MVNQPKDPFVAISQQRQEQEAIKSQQSFIVERKRELGTIEQERNAAIREKESKIKDWAKREEQLILESQEEMRNREQIAASGTGRGDPSFWRQEKIRRDRWEAQQKAKGEVIKRERAEMEAKIAASETKLRTFGKSYLTVEGQSQVETTISEQKKALSEQQSQAEASKLYPQFLAEKQKYLTQESQKKYASDVRTVRAERLAAPTKTQYYIQGVPVSESVAQKYQARPPVSTTPVKTLDINRDVPVVKDELGLKVYKEASKPKKAAMLYSTVFSGKGLELIGTTAVGGREAGEKVIGAHVGSSIGVKRDVFARRTAIGSITGSPTGVLGTSMFAGAGLTALGASSKAYTVGKYTLTGAKVMSSTPVQAGSAILTGVYGGTRGVQFAEASGIKYGRPADKGKLVELGVRTGLEVGGFIGGAHAQKQYILKQEVGIQKSVSYEEVVMKKDDATLSQGQRQMEAEFAGRKFKGKSVSQTVTQKFDKPYLDLKDKMITESVSGTKGVVATQMEGQGKIKGEGFVSTTKTSPKTDIGTRWHISDTMTSGGKSFRTLGESKTITKIPNEFMTVKRTGSITSSPKMVGKDITFIKDMPTTKTETFQMFTGTKVTKTATTPAKTTVTSGGSAAKAEASIFKSQVKSFIQTEKLIPPTSIGILGVMTKQEQMQKQKQGQISITVPKEEQMFKVTQSKVTSVKPTTKTIPTSVSGISYASATETIPVQIEGIGEAVIVAPVSSEITKPPIAPRGTGLLLPPFDTGIRKKQPKKRKKGKSKEVYTPSLTAAAFGITAKDIGMKTKGLQKKTFTGFEFRPLIKKPKRFNIKKLFIGKKMKEVKL